MCGRYYLDTLPETLMEYFSISGVPDFASNFNITPSQTVPIIVKGKAEREAVEARWGLIPSWAKDMKIGNRMINARSETVAQKPAFRNAWKKQRCLVPVSGFYEWQRRGKSSKQPHVIKGKDQPLLAFGGLWEEWQRAEESIRSFSILTTQPNTVMAPIHDRMPVIITAGNFKRWLNDDADSLEELLAPCDNAILDTYPISTAVNSPANNGPELLKPISEFSLDDQS